jgi:hypothetical protein
MLGMPDWVYEFKLDKSLFLMFPEIMARPIEYTEAQPINVDSKQAASKQVMQLV